MADRIDRHHTIAHVTSTTRAVGLPVLSPQWSIPQHTCTQIRTEAHPANGSSFGSNVQTASALRFPSFLSGEKSEARVDRTKFSVQRVIFFLNIKDAFLLGVWLRNRSFAGSVHVVACTWSTHQRSQHNGCNDVPGETLPRFDQQPRATSPSNKESSQTFEKSRWV